MLKHQQKSQGEGYCLCSPGNSYSSGKRPQIWKEMGKSLALPVHLVACCLSSKLERLEDENRYQISYFLTPVKLGRGGFQVQPMTQPLIYFWRGTVARAGRFNTFSWPILRGAVL